MGEAGKKRTKLKQQSKTKKSIQFIEQTNKNTNQTIEEMNYNIFH
jgi:hypothetical protein